MYYNDYFFLRNMPNFDALAFITKRNIMFHGFGVFSNYQNLDMNLTVAWAIDNERSDDHVISLIDSDKDPDNRWFTINLKSDFDIKPIKVQ